MLLFRPASFFLTASIIAVFVSVISTLPSHAFELSGKDAEEIPNFSDNVFAPTDRQSFTLPFRTSTLQALLKKVNENPLSIQDKLRIVFAARRIFSDLNPHRFLQLNIYGVDIVSDFTKYAESLTLGSISGNQTNAEFHADMISFFQTANDFHTAYFPPPPLRTFQAMLPFSIQEVFPAPTNATSRRVPTYIAYDVFPTLLQDPNFTDGSIILAWDGVDIRQAVRNNGRNGYGSNRAAKIANAVADLTFLQLQFAPLPARPFVNVTYQSSGGIINNIQAPWFFLNLSAPVSTSQNSTPADLKHGIRPSHDSLLQFSLESTQSKNSASASVVHTSSTHRQVLPVGDDFKSFFSASIINTSTGPLGYLKVSSFGSSDLEPIAVQLTEILNKVPDRGLVVDLRGNRGGKVAFVKVVLELLSSKNIPEIPASIRATDFVDRFLEEVETSTELGEIPLNISTGFRVAVSTARQSGERFTGPVGDLVKLFPERGSAARQKRAYFGPFVTLIDGLTYSAGDLFAALQVDENISLLVGVSDNTGAGGAVTLGYSGLSNVAPKTFPPLPGGVEFSMSVMRFYRTGTNSGAIVEFFGVKPDVRYYLTAEDVLNDDSDLFEFLSEKFVPQK